MQSADNDALQLRQDKLVKNSDPLREHAFQPKGSIEAAKREDSRPWTFGMVIDHSDNEHNSQSHKACTTKTGRIVTRSARNVELTPI